LIERRMPDQLKINALIKHLRQSELPNTSSCGTHFQ
jgi:hypothetical protein